MELHRTSGRADWLEVAAERRNSWQRLAALSRGVITPGNIVTIAGLCIAVLGLVWIAERQFWAGLGALVGGRLCDVLDGWLANRTGTKSPLGEFLDVVADKLTVLGVVISFWVAHLMPYWLLAAFVAPHLIISLLSILASLRHTPLHPSRFGKANMAASWLIMPGIVVAYALNTAPGWLLTVLEIAAVLNILTGLYVAREYSRGRD